MAKFDLKDLLNNRSKETDMQEEEYKTDGVVELVDIYDMIPSQDNFYSVAEIMDLVNSIKLVGILQPLLLTESDEEGKFGIKAGHRRREALLYLVEKEGLEKYRYAPTIIKPEQDNVIGKLTIIMANRFREKTDWEKMQEVIQTEELLTELKGNRNLNKSTREQLKEMLGIESEQNLKTRDFVAQILGMSAAQIGRFKAIYNNLSDDLMAAFKENQINVSVAAEISGLSQEWQDKASEMLKDKGALQIADVKNLKQQEIDNKPLEGQIKIKDLKPFQKEKINECVFNFYELIMNEDEKKLAQQRKNKELEGQLYAHWRNGGGSRENLNWNCKAYEIIFWFDDSDEKIEMTWFRFVDTLFKVLDEKGICADKEGHCTHFPKCFLCDMPDCNSRQEDRTYCIYDKEKSCNIKNAIKLMYENEPEKEKHCTGCCRNCPEKLTCGYACYNSKKDIDNTAQNTLQAADTFEADPEYKDILCYSCLHYSECDKKATTVVKCYSYENKAESEKTQEQLYSEEQDKIDRETAAKIREMHREDSQKDVLPTGDKRTPRDDFEITVTTRQYAEVFYGHTNFLVTVNKEYREDDTVTLKEYLKGEPTGKALVVKLKNIVKDCTGIEDGYCVIGFYVIKRNTVESEGSV